MKKLKFLLFITLLMYFSSCDILRQVQEMQMLSKCEFRIHTLTDIQLAGVNISKIQNISDVNPLDVIKLSNAVINNQLPLNFNLNLQVRNPNKQAASLNRIEWVLFIDELQMIEGLVDQQFRVDATSTATLPVQIGFNLAEVLKGERGNKIIDFALGLADGSGTNQRVMVKLKPSVMVGPRSVAYPGWINVRNDYVSQ